MVPTVIATLLLLLCNPATAIASARSQCRQGCARAESSCVSQARTHRQTLRAACTGTGAARRQCLRGAAAAAGGERRACTRFAVGCQSCCKGDGTDCPARCGDSFVTATRGETCDPPGSSCAVSAACGADCRCPATVTSTTAPTTTTLPPTTGPLGPATFVLGPRTTWVGSSSLDFGLIQDFAGALVFDAEGDPDGEASLAVGADSTFGVQFFGGGYLCLQLLADGSAGVLHCTGSAHGVDASWTIDSNRFGPSLSSVVSTALGGPSSAGGAFVVAPMRVVSCPVEGGGGDAGCLAPLTSAEDCRDAAKVTFAFALPFAAVLTTGTATAEIANPRADSLNAAIQTGAAGEPFSCAAWKRAGSEAVLTFPLPVVNVAGVGDWTSVAVLHLVRTSGR